MDFSRYSSEHEKIIFSQNFCSTLCRKDRNLLPTKKIIENRIGNIHFSISIGRFGRTKCAESYGKWYKVHRI